MYIRETVADSPLTRINFQPSCAQCEIYLYTFFIRVVMVVWERRCVDAFGRNRNQTGCTKLSSRRPQRPDTDSALSCERRERIETIHASGVLPFSAATLPCQVS